MIKRTAIAAALAAAMTPFWPVTDAPAPQGTEPQTVISLLEPYGGCKEWRPAYGAKPPACR